MKLLIILFLCLSVTTTFVKSDLEKKWNAFKKSNGKEYGNVTEDSLRKTIFKKNIAKITEHNQRYKKGLETYKIGVNQFSDYTENELVTAKYGLFPSSQEYKPLVSVTVSGIELKRTRISKQVNWVTRSMVTPVKNQGLCSSCWAFATTGALESHYKIYHDTDVDLSEQELIDCVPKARGCTGGWMTDAYAYIYQNGGINPNSYYPYKGNSSCCRHNTIVPKIPIRGYGTLVQPDEELLKYVVAVIGPVAVAIDTSTGDFAGYTSGIYYNPKCNNYTFSHALVIVGYGRENGLDYWLMKNSYGVNWGLGGYFKMIRNWGNHCGVASKVSFPIL